MDERIVFKIKSQITYANVQCTRKNVCNVRKIASPNQFTQPLDTFIAFLFAALDAFLI